MRPLLPLLFLLACDPPPATDASDSTDTTDDTDVVPEVRPALPIIPDAEDLDEDPDVVRVALTAAPHTFTIGGQEVEGYAYNGGVPGPTIRAKLGDTVIVEITNGLEDPTTVHWHGAHVPYAMDGVTWTEDPIAPGETFTATFTATHAGTSWYHPHFDTARQVDLGLYGALVVTDPDEPAVDRDLVVIADAWGEHDARTPPEGDNHHGLDGAGMTWTFNGAIDPVLDVEPGERVRLRLINASNTGYLDLAPTSGARFIAGDQGLWAGPADHALLGPGDRVEAELVVGGDDVGFDNHAYSLYGGTVGAGELTARLHLRPTAAGATPALADWPWRSPSTSPDPGRTDLRFVLQGDSAGEHWTINGETFPDVTVPYVPIGQDTLVEVRNISPTNHPFHMHGHAFEVLSIDGVPLPDRPVEDTVDVGIRQTMRLRFLADNAGYWMTHCHILPHAEGGMMTVVEVGE